MATTIAFTKATYDRPLRIGDDLHPSAGRSDGATSHPSNTNSPERRKSDAAEIFRRLGGGSHGVSN
jgi:hypothetical protein